MAVAPTVLAPFFLVLAYPFFLIVKKLAGTGGAKMNDTVVCGFVFLPLGLAQLLCFFLLNLFLAPLAYIVGLYSLMTQNPYVDSHSKRNKCVRVLLFALLGLPFLLLSQLPNAFFFLKSLFSGNTDALAAEQSRQSPVTTRNLQRMY